MEFQELFDELENNSLEQPYQWNKQANSLHLQTIDQESVDLLAPIIGVDFVAGLAQDLGDWMCFANCHIAHISPKQSGDSDLPLLRQQNITLTNFIKTLDRPTRVILRYTGGFETSVNLLDADEQFLISERDVLVPISGVIQLRVLGSTRWQ